jgi:hypothetical protein
MRVRENLDDGRYAEFLTELNGNLDRFNQSNDETLLVGADYLEVVIVK